MFLLYFLLFSRNVHAKLAFLHHDPTFCKFIVQLALFVSKRFTSEGLSKADCDATDEHRSKCPSRESVRSFLGQNENPHDQGGTSGIDVSKSCGSERQEDKAK